MRAAKFKLKVPCIMQFAETECGVAALAMLFAYHRASVPIDVLRDKCGASRDGSRATTLIQVAKDLGFAAAGYRVELADIIKLRQPLIAFWNFNHYVVICGADNNDVYINDPACGAVRVSLAEFDKAFTGVVIAIAATDKTVRQKKNFSVLKFCREWISGFGSEWIFIILASLLCSLMPLINSALSSIFINYCIIANNKTWVPWLALLSAIFTIVFLLITTMQRTSQFQIGTKASLVKLSYLLTHALKLPLIYYALRQKSEIINIFSRAEAIVGSLFKNVTLIVVNLIMGLVCLLVMIKIDLSLATKSIALIILFSIIMFFMEKINFDYEKNNIAAESKLFSNTMSNFRNLETIKACGMEDSVLNKWQKLFARRTGTMEYLVVNAAKIISLSQFVNVFSLLIILYWGSIRVSAGFLSLGNLMAYYAMHLAFCRNVDAILQAIKEGQNAYAAHFRIDDIKNYTADSRFSNVNNCLEINDFETFMSCTNLTFYYNKHSRANLNKINLSINRGQHIALVGDTGSGKSTLARLLCGLYSAHEGEITLSGNNLKNFTAADFNNYFSYVSQDVSLFSGTLYENITLACEQPDLDKINEAVRIACLQDLIKKRGLYAVVTEGGQNFSGGEKQRIDIARALLQDTPVLVLDEATSALDIPTENILIKNLQDLNKTIIYVAHRLSTTRHCDQIYVLKNGEIINQGTYETLFSAVES